MDDRDDNLKPTPDDGSLSVDSILAEYEAERVLFDEPTAEPEPVLPPEPPAKSHRIVYDSREQAVGEEELSQSPAPYAMAGAAGRQREAPEPVFRQHFPQEPDTYSPESDFYSDRPEPHSDRPEPYKEPAGPPEREAPRDEFGYKYHVDDLISETEVTDEDASDAEYARREDYQKPRYEPEDTSRGPDLTARVLGPMIALLGEAGRRREKKRRVENEKKEARRAARQEDLLPEMRIDRAAAFYAAQAGALKTRCLIACVPALILLWLSFGLPAAGALGNSPAIKAIVCLILELCVLVIGLDIFTTGVLTLVRRRPGAESLIVASCVLSALDAVNIAATGDMNVGLPFCGVSALSVLLALWGNFFACRGFAISFETAAAAENPTVVLSLAGVDEEGSVLAKTKRPVTGLVRMSEAADLFESAYRFLAPTLMLGSVILSLFVYLAGKDCTNLIHTMASGMAACASLSAVFGFAFPFFVLAKRLSQSGAAMAGFSGAADLGRIRRVLVSDTDIFPVRTLSIADVSMAEGARPETVIAYTGSMISAAGLGIAPVFTELMKKNNCGMQKIEDFACHEGGGLVARINGDVVYVGTSGYMQLMGIRLPRGVSSRAAIYTAINDSLCGIFAVNYVPVASVQRALVSLLKGKTEPLFGIRDFNITPMLVKQKFRLPIDSYDFPSFADRYRISSPVEEERGTVVGVFARGNLNSVAGLASRGRKLYNRLRVSLALSLLGTVVGLVLMLALCWSGSFDSASCGNLMAYMLLWLAPVFVVSLGLRN